MFMMGDAFEIGFVVMENLIIFFTNSYGQLKSKPILKISTLTLPLQSDFPITFVMGDAFCNLFCCKGNLHSAGFLNLNI